MKTELKGYLYPNLKQKLQGPYGHKKQIAGYIPARKGSYRILDEALSLPTPQPDFSAPADIINASCITHPESDDHLLARIPCRGEGHHFIKTAPSSTLDKERTKCRIPNQRFVVGHLTEPLKSAQIETGQNGEVMFGIVKEGRHKDIKANEDRIPPLTEPVRNVVTPYTDDLRLRKDIFQTIKKYRYTFKEFCTTFPDSLSSEIRAADTKAWLTVKVRKGWNESSLITTVSALRLHDSNIVQRQDGIFYLPFPRREEKLPSVLKSKEVLALFNLSGNLKHMTIIMMPCAGGLRENEVATINKTATAINTGRMVIPVKGTKGKKDKCVPLTQALFLSLERYYTACTPREYIFEGQNMNHYSTRRLRRTQSPLVGLMKCKNAD